LRKTKVFDGSKFENDAEHSWTICLMASLLREYSNFEINIERVMLMLQIHDVVEIDAGDIFLYASDREVAHIAEDKAANRIFSILPEDQYLEYYNLWNEFEERKSNDSKFASVFDRFEPILQNYKNKGLSWKEHNVTKDMVLKMNAHIKDGSEEIWNVYLSLIDECVKKGYLKE
jgi:putative hydrolases of HD superfamily